MDDCHLAASGLMIQRSEGRIPQGRVTGRGRFETCCLLMTNSLYCTQAAPLGLGPLPPPWFC